MGARNAIHGATLIARTMTIMQSREPKRTNAKRQKWQKATTTERQSVVSGGGQNGIGTDSAGNYALYYGGICVGQNITEINIINHCKENCLNMRYEPITLRFNVKRMNRKRIVKLLMAGGHSRNAANCIARSWCWNYAKNYLRYAITGELF